MSWRRLRLLPKCVKYQNSIRILGEVKDPELAGAIFDP
jgi:hypothetical protein